MCVYVSAIFGRSRVLNARSIIFDSESSSVLVVSSWINEFPQSGCRRGEKEREKGRGGKERERETMTRTRKAAIGEDIEVCGDGDIDRDSGARQSRGKRSLNPSVISFVDLFNR